MSIRNRLGIRSGAVILAVGGLGLGLIGSGVHAAFTDGGTATENISVGSLSIALSSTTTGAVVTTHSITFSPASFASSAASSAPLEFTVTNTGSIPAVVTFTAADTFTSTSFSDLFTVPSPVTVPVGGHFDYNGGIGWTALGTADEGKTESVLYTISASA